jgi:3'(2'), 5'-bisphosphate nucleotidase
MTAHRKIIAKNHMLTLLNAALDAGDHIMEHTGNVADLNVIQKGNGTPVTEIDQQAEEICFQALQQVALDKDIPMIGEERHALEKAPALNGRDCYWMVDALDGTKEFLAGTGEFTVNIALLEGHRPVLGVIYAPALDDMYFAVKGQGAFKAKGQDIRAQGMNASFQRLVMDRLDDAQSETELTLITSRRQKTSSHVRRIFNDYVIASRKHCGSSLKFALIAEGKADIYPRLGYTCEWDTAAGDAILTEAGGVLVDIDTGAQLLQYGKESNQFLNPSFVAIHRDIWLKHKADFTHQMIPPKK